MPPTLVFTEEQREREREKYFIQSDVVKDKENSEEQDGRVWPLDNLLD